MLETLVEICRLRCKGVKISPTSHPRIARGADVCISRGVAIAGGTIIVVDASSQFSVGLASVIGDYCNLRAVGGPIHIGSRVRLGQFVSIIGANHAVSPEGEVLESTAPSLGVSIGDGCWLGVGVTVLPNVRLGAQCIVGANSVVTRDFPERSVLVGAPARPLRVEQ